jgi:hypothetical protein
MCRMSDRQDYAELERVRGLRSGLAAEGSVTLAKAFWMPLAVAVALGASTPVFLWLARSADGPGRVIGWFSVLLMPMVALLMLSLVADRRPVVVDREGIHVPGWYGWDLAWSDIATITVHGQHRYALRVEVGVEDRDRAVAGLVRPGLGGVLARRNPVTGLVHLQLPRLERPPTEVFTFLGEELEARNG